MTCVVPWTLERYCSIQDEEHTKKTHQQEAEDEDHDGSAAGQAGVDVGKPTIPADFTTCADGFHYDNIFPHAARAMTDFFHAPTQTQA